MPSVLAKRLARPNLGIEAEDIDQELWIEAQRGRTGPNAAIDVVRRLGVPGYRRGRKADIQASALAVPVDTPVPFDDSGIALSKILNSPKVHRSLSRVMRVVLRRLLGGETHSEIAKRYRIRHGEKRSRLSVSRISQLAAEGLRAIRAALKIEPYPEHQHHWKKYGFEPTGAQKFRCSVCQIVTVPSRITREEKKQAIALALCEPGATIAAVAERLGFSRSAVQRVNCIVRNQRPPCNCGEPAGHKYKCREGIR